MKELKLMEASKCPKCGEEPFFVEHIEKWYCYECNTYVDGTEEDHEHAEETVEHIEDQVESEIAPAVIDSEQMDEVPVREAFKDYSDDYEDELAADLAEISEVEPKEAVLSAIPKGVPDVVAPAAEPKTDMTIRMCTNCGQPLKWIEKYQRHYCYGCKKYAPKEDKPKEEAKPAPEMKACPDCGGELKYVEKYSEWYCYSCKKYPLRRKKAVEQPKPAAKPSTKPSGAGMCPKCGKPLKWIEKYERHYCVACKEYAPKEKKTCPACGDDMKFIPEYNEWYCYKCKKYSLRPSKPVFLL